MDIVDGTAELPADPPEAPPAQRISFGHGLAIAAIAMALIVGATVFIVGRRENRAASKVVGPSVANPGDTDPANTHWHAALGVYDCNAWMGDTGPGTWKWPGTTSEGIFRARTHTYAGLHSHNDGIMHMEPATEDDAAANATVGRYFEEGGWALSSEGFSFLAVTRRNGDTCAGQPGTLRWWVNRARQSGNPASYKLYDNDVVVISFSARDAYPGDPPSEKNLPRSQSAEFQTPNSSPPLGPTITVP